MEGGDVFARALRAMCCSLANERRVGSSSRNPGDVDCFVVGVVVDAGFAASLLQKEVVVHGFVVRVPLDVNQ